MVIFIHGLASAIETWALNVEALAQHQRVYALDLVGSGRSDKPLDSYSLVALAEFVKGFVDVMGLDRVSLIGNSMGGGVALQFALLYPQQIEKLVLVNSLGLGQEVSWSLRLAKSAASRPILQAHPQQYSLDFEAGRRESSADYG